MKEQKKTNAPLLPGLDVLRPRVARTALESLAHVQNLCSSLRCLSP